MSRGYTDTGLHALRAVGCAVVLAALAACAGGPGRVAEPAASGVPAQITEAERRDFEAALADMQDQRWERALGRLEQLAGQRPDLPGPRVNLAIVLRASGNASGARSLLESLIEVHPDFAPAHHQRALMLREGGRFDAADEAYEQALAADPDYALAHFNRAVLNDLYLARPAVALMHFQRYRQITNGEGADVSRWIVELQRRVDVEASTRVADSGGGA